MDVFLAAPFDAREVVSGLGGDPAARDAAHLPGHGVRLDCARLALALVPDEREEAAGHVVSFGAGDAERIGFVFAALGTPLVRRTVAARDCRYEVLAPVASEPAGYPHTPEPADINGERVGLLREMIREIAGHFGSRGADDTASLRHGIGFRALARMRAQTCPAVEDRLRSGLGIADVATEGRSYPYAKYFGVEEHHLRHRRFDGSWSDTVLRAVLASGDAVTVLPWDPDLDAVLLVEQLRAGPVARRDPQPWSLEAIAGRCDGLESCGAAARREAREEAGLDLGRLERISGYYPTPGTSAEFITSFVGEAGLGRAGGIHGLPEEQEDIRAIVVERAIAMDAITRGEINNAPLVLSLYWLTANVDRLRDLWRLA